MKTFEQVRTILSAIEPGEDMYAQLDRDDLPHLQRLIHDPEPWRAARAVHAAARLGTPASEELIRSAMTDERREIRVAVAHAAPKLPPNLNNEVLEHLIDDADPSIKKVAVKSIGPRASDALKTKLRTLASDDQLKMLKSAAEKKLDLLR